MNDDPCDEWPVVEHRGEWYIGARVYSEWAYDSVIVFERVSSALHDFGRALVLAADAMSDVMFKPAKSEYIELDNRKARGYRQFEYGGARWGKTNSLRWKNKR